jgi:spermidine synthase
MLALIGGLDGGYVNVDALATHLEDPAVRTVSRPIGFEAPIDILGQYVGGARALTALAGVGPRNTDDYPFVALDARRNVRSLSASPSALLLAMERLSRPDPAELLADPRRAALDERLNAYWHARNQFLEAGAALEGEPRGVALVEAASPGLLAAIRLSPEFNPAYQPLLGMARSLMTSNRQAASRLLHKINDAAPSRNEARELLSAEFGE